jgi:MraZ protein
MFLGTYQHTIDSKGRLFIPARFRSQVNQRFIVTRGLERCLFAFPEDEWERQQGQIKDQSLMKKEVRAFNRLFFAGAAEVICDKQGRINLPGTLIEYANLEGEAKIIGVSNRFEIWSVDSWKEYEEESTRRYEEIAENLME